MTLHEIVPLFQGTFTAILFILVLKQSRRNTDARLCAMFLAGMTLWGFLIGGMRNSSNLAHAVYWEKAALTMIAFAAVFFYLFVSHYTGMKARIGTRLVVLYFLATIAIAPSNLLVEGMGVDRFGNAPVWGIVFHPWMAIIYVLIIIAMLKLNHARKVSTSYEARNRYLYFMFGAGFSLIGGLLDILPALGFSVYPSGILTNTVFSLLIALAILQYHLLDIQVTLRASLAHMLTGILVALPVACVGVLGTLLVQLWGFSVWIIVMPLSLISAFIVAPLWGRANDLVKRRVRGQRYAHLKALEQFSHKRVRISGLEELCSSIVNLVDSALRPASICLFTERGDGSFQVAASCGVETDQARSIQLPGDHPLVVWLKLNEGLLWHRQLDILPELQVMTEEDRRVLGYIEAELYYPLGLTKLTGLLALGPKPAGQIYSWEDLGFVATLTHQASLELENAQLFGQEKAQRERVERFNIERSTFLDALAHEMKTPLTSATSSSELLVGELADCPENLKLLADDIQASVGNLGRIVNDVLEFGRGQQTRVSCIVQPVELCQLVSTVKMESNSLLRRKQQSLVLMLPDAPLWVRADSERLKQVLRNILDNAAKFSPPDSEIRLRVMNLDHSAQIEVGDSAEPIIVDDQEHLFTPYYRGKLAQQRQLPGLGLGLFICKQLIELQNGKIWLANGKQKGNVFCISLPKGG